MKKLNAEQKQICRRLLALLLVFIVGLTGALAFLTASDSRKNVFTVGDVDIILHEPDWRDLDEDGNYDRDDNLNHNILPGQKIPKAPYIENVGKNDAWVYITVSVPTTDIEEIYEVDGKIAISGEQLDMNVTAYAIQDGYKGGHSYTEISDYFKGKHEDLFGTEISIQEASTQLAVFKLLAYENSEKMIDDNWEQIGDVYRSVDSNGKHYNNYIFAYNKILPKGTSSEPVFRYVELYENIGEAKPVVLTYWVNNQEVEEALETMSFNTFALNGTTFSVEDAASQTASEEDLSNYTAVKTEIYNPGEKVTELYFNDELAKAGYSFDWKFSTNSAESAYAGMTIEEDTNLVSDYSTILENENTTEADYLSYLIQYNEKYGGLYALLTGANPNHPNYPSEPTEVVVPTYLYATFDGNTVNIKNGTFVDFTEFPLSNKDGNYVRGQSYMNEGIEYKIPVRKTYSGQNLSGSSYVTKFKKPLVDISQSVVFPDTMVEMDWLLSGTLLVLETEPNTILEKVDLPFNVRKISGTFKGCPKLTSVEFGPTITEITNSAFAGTGLIELNLPESVNIIGEGAFSNCKSLTELNLHSNITSVGVDAFASSGVKNVTMDKSVTYLGRRAFNGTSMNNFYYTGTADDWCNITYDEREGYEYQSHPNYFTQALYFEGDKLVEDITLTAAVKDIPNYAFTKTKSLVNVKFPNNLNSIGIYAFNGCSKLNNIKIPNSITELKKGTFMSCSSLSDIDFGTGLKTIGDDALRETKISKLVIPANVESLGSGAFRSSKVSELEINGNVEINNTSYGSFYNCTALKTLKLGPNAAEINFTALKDTNVNWTSFDVDPNNPYYSAEDGVLFNKTKTQLILFPTGKSVASYTISDSVKEIAPSAFSGNTALKTIIIPESVEVIGTAAFWGCKNLTTANIPNNVAVLNTNVFGNCQKLTNLTLGANIIEMKDRVFYDCDALTSIVIPDSVKTLGSVFSDCTYLKDITIPASVENINSQFLFNCTSGTVITYTGTMEQWEAYNIYTGTVSNATVVCSDGTLTYVK